MAVREITYVGFYGCSGRVVRCATPTQTISIQEGEQTRRPKLRHHVECPSCGYSHRVKLSWRAPTPYDEGREPDLVLLTEEAT